MNTDMHAIDFNTFNDPENSEHWLALEKMIVKIPRKFGFAARQAERLCIDLLEVAIDLKPTDHSAGKFHVRRFFDVTVRYYLYRELCKMFMLHWSYSQNQPVSKVWVSSDWMMVAIYASFAPIVKAFQPQLNDHGQQSVSERLGPQLLTENNFGAIYNYRAEYLQQLASHLDRTKHHATALEKTWLLYAGKEDAAVDAERVSKFYWLSPLDSDAETLQPMTTLPELPVITIAQFMAMLPVGYSALDVARVTADRTTFSVLEVSLLAKRIIEGE